MSAHHAGIRLELLAAGHLPAVDELVADAETRRFTRIPEPPPTGFTQAWFSRYEDGRREGTREAFAIIEVDAGNVVGLALAPTIDRDSATTELGYIVSPQARGRGIATAALRELTDWAFKELGAHRLELLISVANEASKRVAERAGYVREGVLRSVYVKRGAREDTEIWSRLATDVWPGEKPER